MSRVHRDEYVRKESPGALSETVAGHLAGVYDGDLDDGYWVAADLKSTSEVAVTGHAREIHECLRHVQEVQRETGAKVSQNPFELRSSLAEEPVLIPSPSITPRLKRQEASRDEFCGGINH